MEHYVLDFIPPLVGLEDEFNTIRVGMAWAKKLIPGDTVYLMDNKQRKIIGMAKVTEIHVASLEEICLEHGAANHTQLGDSGVTSTTSGSPMLAIVQKIYGPHIATPTKKSTAIYLKRLH